MFVFLLVENTSFEMAFICFLGIDKLNLLSLKIVYYGN